MNSTRCWIRAVSSFLIVGIAIGVCNRPAYADPIVSVLLDPMKYGDLDQTDVEDFAATLGLNFAGCLCGPTAAVNSFVYLQEMFPNKYDNLLVVDDPNTAANAMIDTALNLAVNYMNSEGGTFIEDFIHGKRSYMDLVAPRRTRYSAQIAIEWNVERTNNMDDSDEPATAPGNDNIPKPNFVRDTTVPKLGYIASQLRKKEDVEIFVTNGLDHYLTVTGIAFNRKTRMGMLHFVDPDDGMHHTTDITGLDANGIIQLDYAGGSRVAHVVTESVPEPATMLLVGIGIAGYGWRRRNHAAKG